MKIDQYAPYIFSSYAITFVLIAVLAIHAAVKYRKLKVKLDNKNK